MPNAAHLRFLVVDDNGESRMLLTKSLMRKFPASAVIECQEATTAAALLRGEPIDAVVAHRTFDHSGPQLVGVLRKANSTVPIIAVSGYDQAESSRFAGADAFLNYDAWLQIGTVVADAIAMKAKAPRAQPELVLQTVPNTRGAAVKDREPRSKTR